MRLLRELHARTGHLLHELAKYGVVGVVALVVDVVTFNLAQYAGGEGPLHGRPLSAKVVSTVLAATVAFVGNRLWTFRHRQRTNVAREYTLFFAFNAVGLVITLGCLGVSHYAFGLRSALADNVSANGVGLCIATAFRFWSYRRYVFRAVAPPAATQVV